MTIAARRRRRDRVDHEDLVRSLYGQHGAAILAFATRLTGDRAAAEDVVQETLLRAWRNVDKLVEERGSVRGWLLTVAHNIAVDRMRAKASRPTEVAESPARPAMDKDHAEDVVNSMVVLNALESVSEEHRHVLVEIYYRGRSVTETAQRLGIPPGTVKSRCYYALRAMRSVLRDAPAGAVLR